MVFINSVLAVPDLLVGDGNHFPLHWVGVCVFVVPISIPCFYMPPFICMPCLDLPTFVMLGFV